MNDEISVVAPSLRKGRGLGMGSKNPQKSMKNNPAENFSATNLHR
jgi:hypothetical protein